MLENCMCSRCWAGFGLSLDGRPMDGAEIPAVGSSKHLRFVKCVPKRDLTMLDAWRRLIAARWLEHVAGYQ
jgi:hypothetical protein